MEVDGAEGFGRRAVVDAGGEEGCDVEDECGGFGGVDIVSLGSLPCRRVFYCCDVG